MATIPSTGTGSSYSISASFVFNTVTDSTVKFDAGASGGAPPYVDILGAHRPMRPHLVVDLERATLLGR